MTLPKNVDDAVRLIDESASVNPSVNPECSALVKLVDTLDWHTIRTELRRLTDRLEAADALLREIMEFGEDRELHIRIQDHLTTSANG